jgi:hypothetical protein
MSESTAPRVTLRIPENLATYYAVLLFPGPAYDGFPPASAEQGAVLQAHAAHVFEVQKPGGPAVAGGPLLRLPGQAPDPEAPLGMLIYRVGSAEEAERLAQQDPGVRAGRFRYTLHSWLVPQGQLPH